MKTKVTKILLFTMILVLAFACLTSCNKDKDYTVTVMYGEETLTEIKVSKESALDMEEVKKSVQKDGLTFVGLYTDAELTTPFVQETEITGNLTLYAKYEATNLYIIVNSNGGSSVEKVKVQTGAEYTVAEPTREGYVFTGYTRYDYAQEKDVEFATTGTYTLAEDARITANWEIKQYTVTFYDGETKLDQFQQTVEHGKTATLSVYAKEGYDFNGWMEKDATETFKPATAITKNVDLYASFTAKTFTISFNSNGGSAIADLPVTYGAAFDLPNPTRTGYTFTGYTLNGDPYVKPATYQLTENLRLVANWTIDTFTVTYKDSEEEVISTVENVEYGTKVTGVANKAGYTTEGYYLTKEFDGEKVTLSTYAITADTVLFVKYVANQYTISFNSNGGSAIADLPVTYGAAFELPNPTRTGYTFTGYTLNGDPYVKPATYQLTENLRLVANWTIDTFTVTYKDSEEEVISTVENVEYGTKVTGVANKAGYTTEGYYLTKEFDGEKVTLSSYEITEDTVLFVKYVANQYTISFNSNGGDAIDNLSVTYGAAFDLPNPTRTGYTFTGYTLNGDPYVKPATYQLTENLRLVANWTIDTFTVTYKDSEEEVISTVENVEYGTKVTGVANKAGYTTEGYYLTKEFDGEKVTLSSYEITEDTVLFVKYVANQYTITVTNYSAANCEVAFDSDYELPTKEELEAAKAGEWLSFDGYKFGTADGEDFARTGKYTWTENIIVVATYTKDPMYLKSTVTLLDGATSMGEIVVDDGYTIEDDLPGINTQKTGYTFNGWYTSSGFEAETAFNASTDTIDKDTTLYAKYTANSYTIYIIANGWTVASQISVTYGQTFTLPTPTSKKGYTFKNYSYAEETFASTTEYTYNYAQDIQVAVVDMRNKVTVSFVSGGNNYGDAVEANQYDNFAVVKPAVDPTKTGYTFKWWSTTNNGSEVAANTEIENDTEFYAVFEANTYTITIVNNGWTVASSISVTYGQTFTLPTPTDKRGYTFEKYTYGGETFVSGTYTYTTDIQIEVVDSQNKVTVHFVNYGGDVEIDQYATFGSIKPADPTKTGYTFNWWSTTNNGVAVDDEMEIEAATDFYAVFEANAYTIVLDYGNGQVDIPVVYDGEYNIPAAPTRFGYTFGKYVYTDGGDDYDGQYNGTWKLTANLYLTIVWEDNTFIKNSEKKYFQEVENGNNYYTYVFLTGESYQFEGYTVTPDALINSTAPDTFKALTPGNFDLVLTPAEGDVVTRKAKIVYSIGSMNMGSDYNAMIANVDDDTKYQVTTTENDYVMSAGISNFVPDVSIFNDSLMAMSIDDANIELLLKEGETDLNPNLAGRTGNTFNFDSSLVGKNITITLQSKYDIKANPTILSMKLALNNGVNVYNNLQMKQNYSNGSVQTINVLRNIRAELVASDYLPGHGEAYGNVTLSTGTLENINVGAPKNEFNNGVYTRTTQNKNDNLVVNGNYFAIDGSKLPYIDNRYDQYGAAGSNLTSGDAYRLANTQIGIFLYRCADVTADTTGQIRKFHQGKVTFNNLRIQANNLYNAAAEEDLGDEGFPLLKMSAAYIGFVLRGGTMTLNNVAIKDTSMGFMVHGSVSGYDTPGKTADSLVMGNVQPEETQSAHLVLNSCIVENSWANHIYTFDLAKVTLTNTKLTGSCGPAISVDDRPYAKAGTTGASDYGYSNLDTELIMDVYTSKNINSWVAGNEAWFLAYGMGTLAPGVKTTIHNTVSSNTSSAMGSRKIIGGVEKMNFIVLVRPVGTWTSTITDEDISGGPHVKSQTIDGGFSFFYKDEAEKATVGTEAMKFNDDLTAYGTALGSSDLQTAMAKYGDLMTAGRPFVNQSQSAGAFGTVQIFVAAYYAHELQ